MIGNYFYLIVGLLCLLFAITHTLNGLQTSLASLESGQIDSNAKVALIYVWHITGIENLVFGIAMRWVVITYFTLSDSTERLTQLIPDSIAIFVIIVLLLLGT
jgi:hypothetical protein